MLKQLLTPALPGFGISPKLDMSTPKAAEEEAAQELREDESLPAGNEISLGSKARFMTSALVFSRLAHSQFQINMGHFEQFCVWKYTFGSGKVNSYLINVFPDAEARKLAAVFWTTNFFQDYNVSAYRQKRLHPAFMPYVRFFLIPDDFLPRTALAGDIRAYADKRSKSFHSFNELADIAERVIQLYIRLLSSIVHAAPAHQTLRVYKSSALYPGVPKDRTITSAVTITQLPFNSTSYDPAFNYGTFIAEQDHWLLWSLTIPPETPCLILSELFHAYPFENEVLLPPGVKFSVTASKLDDMRYISKEEYLKQGMRLVQINVRKPLVAPVFMLNTDFDPIIRSKRMHLLEATVLP